MCAHVDDMEHRDELAAGSSSTPPDPDRSWRRKAIAGIAAIALLSGAFGAGVATYLRQYPSGSLASLVSGFTTSAKLSAARVAAEVDPAVVDINVTIDFGQAAASGTGMILTHSGLVLTNNHVVNGATRILVTVAGRRKPYTARVLGVDPSRDVALIQLEGARGLPTVRLANSAVVTIGEPVAAIGNALGLGGKPTVTVGAVTATGRAITAYNQAGSSEHLTGLFQTDAALVSGDSGGPLVNAAGQVVGIDTAAASPTSGPSTVQSSTASQVGFAIPINTAIGIARQIEAHRASATVLLGSHGFLGVDVTDAKDLPLQDQQYLGTLQGAVLVGVVPNTPAWTLGLQPGDVIVGFDGHSVPSAQVLGPLVRAKVPGAKVSLTWVAPNGSHYRATVTLGSAPVE
jgi:S1-C subfamily serine protease